MKKTASNKVKWSLDNIDFAVGVVRDARPAILSALGGNRWTCIFSTRVALGVFASLGIPAREQPVELAVYNPAMRRRLLGPRPGELAGDEKPVQFYIGTHIPIDPSPEVRGWMGHLVCLVQDRLILDMSLDQVNRPEHGIVLEAAVFEPPAEVMFRFLRDEGELAGEVRGCLISYRRTDDRAYKTAGDWSRQHTRKLSVTIAAAVREGLARGLNPEFFTSPLPGGGVNSIDQYSRVRAAGRTYVAGSASIHGPGQADPNHCRV